MASKRTLEFEILAQTKKATKDLTKLRGELGKLDKKIKTSQKSAKGFSASFGKIASLTAGFVSLSAAMQGVSSAITILADFEVQIDKLGAISKASEEDLALLEDEAKRLGETTQYTASQVAEAMNFLAMAGFDANEILASTGDVLNLATIGMMDLGEAADIASNILTGFGMDAEETGRVVDVLAETISSSNTNVQELGAAMSKVAPVAASMNMSLEDTAAVLGVMANAGIKAELAGTQLKMALIQLGTDSKAKSALAELGVNAYDAEGKFKGLIQIVKEMKPALSKMSEEARNAAMVEIFGKRSVASANIFIEKIDTIEEKLKQNQESTGKSAEMAKKFMDNLSGSYKQFLSAIEGVILKFDELSPVLKEALDGTTEFIRSLSDEDIRQFSDGIGSIVELFMGLSKVILYLNTLSLPDWMGGERISNIINPLQKVADLYTDIKNALDDISGKRSALETGGGGSWGEDVAAGADKAIEAIKAVDKEIEKGAKKLTETTKKLTEEEIKALEKLNKQRIKDHSKTIKTLEKEEANLVKDILSLNEKLAKELAGIENDRLKSRVDIESQIRELERGGLNIREEYYQKEKDADQLLSDAKRALAQGDLEAYKTYADAYKSLIQENADKAVEVDGVVIVSSDEVRENSIQNLKDLQGLEDQYYDQKGTAAQAAHDQEIAFKQIELEALKAQLEAEKELIKLLAEVKGVPIDTTAIDAAIEKTGALQERLGAIRDTPAQVVTDTTSVDAAGQKVEQLRTLALNGVTLQVGADTTPADFGIEKLITTAEGNEIKMEVNPEWEKAQKEIEAGKNKVEKKPVDVKVVPNTKLFKTDVEKAKTAAKKPVDIKVDADIATADSKMRKLKADAVKPVSFKVDVDAHAAFATIAELKLPTFSVHTIDVYKNEHFATGGEVGSPLHRAAGGGTYRRLRNGKIPGHDLSGKDDVRVLATRGEYFMNVRATDYYGENFMNAINAMAIPRESLSAGTVQKLAAGGAVGGSLASSSPAALHPVTINMDGKSFSAQMTPEEVVEAFNIGITRQRGL